MLYIVFILGCNAHKKKSITTLFSQFGIEELDRCVQKADLNFIQQFGMTCNAKYKSGLASQSAPFLTRMLNSSKSLPPGSK